MAAFMLHGDRCYEAVGVLLPNGELRPQHYSSVFGPEVNEGAVLIIKKVKPVHNPAARSSTPQLVAATHCVVATLAATFQPGFMIVMPEAWDWDVAQIPGTAFPHKRATHCMPEVCILYVCVQLTLQEFMLGPCTTVRNVIASLQRYATSQKLFAASF